MYHKRMIHMEEKQKRKLPVLYQYEEWLKYYGKVSDETIREAINLIERLLSNQEEAKKQFSRLTAEKKSAIKSIIELSDSINNNRNYSDIELLDFQKMRMEQLNYELDNIRYELETLPKKIQNANIKLLEATVEYSYAELNRREAELTEINREMVEIRDRLRLLYEKRLEHEEWNEQIYVFLHSLLGPHVIERIDDENRKDSNEP